MEPINGKIVAKKNVNPLTVLPGMTARYQESHEQPGLPINEFETFTPHRQEGLSNPMDTLSSKLLMGVLVVSQ